jgi:hypothetical protein
MDSVYSVGYFSLTSSRSMTAGVLLSIILAVLSIYSSLDMPPPDDVLGYTDKVNSRIILVSF